MNIVSIISVIIAFGSLIVSCVAAYISWKNSREQGKLTQRLRNQDQDFERKRFITALWDKMSEMVEIHPDDQGNYNENDILYALNTLELVAICWENKIIDEKMIFLVFGDNYNFRVHEIQSITQPLKHLRKTGQELLRERQVILNVNKDIQEMKAKATRT